MLGKLSAPNVIRPAAAAGIAFVGDAALASDPLAGVGCGWAFQSAEWLVDSTAPALRGDGDLEHALRRYARVFSRRLWPHQLLIGEYARGRRLGGVEHAVLRAASSDPRVVRELERVLSRRHSPAHLLSARFAARVLASGLCERWRGSLASRNVRAGALRR